MRANLIELVETVIIYKLSRLSREEIQAMLEVHDIRETRVYREAKKEGLKEGLKQGLEEGLNEGMTRGRQEGLQQGIALAIDIEKMAAKSMSAEEIASILEVDLELVRRVLNALE